MTIYLVILPCAQAKEIYELSELFYIKSVVESYKKIRTSQCYFASNLFTGPKTAATLLDTSNAQAHTTPASAPKPVTSPRHAQIAKEPKRLTSTVALCFLKFLGTSAKINLVQWNPHHNP